MVELLQVQQADALYDAGIYTRFFFNAPRQFRYILSLNETENFGALQTRLFVKYCAEQEMKKATGEKSAKRYIYPMEEFLYLFEIQEQEK
ncbi:UNKNOWN [Stylonychia lemnae]|uniref:Uncharacterized protein n=1 Tax=Stylonychia lemnae TaxID=5949 RepID=A0A078A9C2_STYLE|nr:UNKNOWN [Stylonychia lemnae]|eukprot:CDW77373.1 UNKNOWN [Stylonychia lemnae]